MAAARGPARRLSLSEVLLHMLQRGSNERSTVTLERNARGATQIGVTVRTGDTEGVTTALDAEREACAIYDRLRAKYPTPDGTVGAEAGPAGGAS